MLEAGFSAAGYDSLLLNLASFTWPENNVMPNNITRIVQSAENCKEFDGVFMGYGFYTRLKRQGWHGD